MSIILNSDSYKSSHFLQYPVDTEKVFSYIESRGGVYDRTLMFGMTMFIKKYLMKPITQADIDEAEELLTSHGEPFNREGWEYILNKHNGYLPLTIRAVPEGFVVPVKNVLVTVVNNDLNCFWLTSFIETALLRAIWYPTTVATVSWHAKQVILKSLRQTSDDPEGQINFKLHDFGARGVSSGESAAIGGLAHLVNFQGTDTIEALVAARKYYDVPMAGFSIPAAEHSTITAWGKDNEAQAYANMLKQFAKPGSLVAVVSDSYDLFNAINNIWGSELKTQVIESGATVVIRPDSGDPTIIPVQTVQALAENFGFTVNNKGYKVLNNVRVIQGDGITGETIPVILDNLNKAGFSTDNLAFGMGGGLLQQVNRDTQRFAMKCSAIQRSNVWEDVRKDPKTDPGKASKSGILTLTKRNNEYVTLSNVTGETNLLEICYNYNKGFRECNYSTFERIRTRSNL